jgi:putative acetyltransferase
MLDKLLMDILIRPERADDHIEIHDITKRAFAPMPFADGDEQELIGKLRNADTLAVSLVAEMDGTVVGQITLTPAFAADGSPGWYALGPIAVAPEQQSQGIGGQLIHAATAWLREQDAAGCVLVGNPAYYSRFGFVGYPTLAPDGEPAEYFQILPLRVCQPNVVVGFHPLFHA